MTKLLILLGTTIGGSAGWWIGALVGTMTAFTVSVLGTALGLYAARRVAADHFE